MKSTNYYVTNSPKYSSNASENNWKPGSSPAVTTSSPPAIDPLESLVSGKLAIIEGGLKQVAEEIEERNTLHEQLVEELDRQLCIQTEALMQTAPHGNMPSTVGDPRRRSAIEKELASLEGDKRHEYIAVWKDIASLKRELRELSREFYEEKQRQWVMRA